MSEFQSNPDQTSQTREGASINIQGMELSSLGVTARDVDELLTRFENEKLGREESNSIVRQLGAIFSENHQYDLANRLLMCERVAGALVNSSFPYWREAVPFLEDACAIRLECSQRSEKYDPQILNHRMFIVGMYRQFSEGSEDFSAFGKQIQKAFTEITRFAGASSSSAATKQRALSLAYTLTEDMPICFWGGTKELSVALGEMAAIAGGTFDRETFKVKISEISDVLPPSCSAYLWGTLAIYWESQAASAKDDKLLESALSAAIKFSERLSEALRSSVEHAPYPTTTDTLGREISLPQYLSQEIVLARLSIAELQFKVGRFDDFFLSWTIAAEASGVLSDEQFDRFSDRLCAMAEQIAGDGNTAYAAEIHLKLAEASYNREVPHYTRVFSYYIDTIEYFSDLGSSSRHLKALKDGVQCFRNNVRSLSDEHFYHAGRFMLNAHSHLTRIQANFERDQISDIPFDLPPASDFEGGRAILDPLAADASIVLRDLLKECERREGSNAALRLSVSAHLCFAEYAVGRGWEELSDVHIAATYDALGGACGDYPEISSHHLVDTQLRLGKLMRERGTEMDFKAFCLFDNALKIVQERTLQLPAVSQAELLYGVGLYLSENDRYGGAISRLSKAYGLLDPERLPEQRHLALTILRQWGQVEIEDGDLQKGRELLLDFEASVHDWNLREFFY